MLMKLKQPIKRKIYIFYLHLLAVIIYKYLIKYQAKQKHSLPIHNTNNELK